LWPAPYSGRAAGRASIPLPNWDGSLKFLVFGDFGTGDREQ
jgi:hypothetical protein